MIARDINKIFKQLLKEEVVEFIMEHNMKNVPFNDEYIKLFNVVYHELGLENINMIDKVNYREISGTHESHKIVFSWQMPNKFDPWWIFFGVVINKQNKFDHTGYELIKADGVPSNELFEKNLNELKAAIKYIKTKL